MWYTLERARITKSFLLKPMLHLAHLIPYNLRGDRARGGERSTGRESHFRRTLPRPKTAGDPGHQGPETLKSAFADKLGMEEYI